MVNNQFHNIIQTLVENFHNKDIHMFLEQTSQNTMLLHRVKSFLLGYDIDLRGMLTHIVNWAVEDTSDQILGQFSAALRIFHLNLDTQFENAIHTLRKESKNYPKEQIEILKQTKNNFLNSQLNEKIIKEPKSSIQAIHKKIEDTSPEFYSPVEFYIDPPANYFLENSEKLIQDTKKEFKLVDYAFSELLESILNLKSNRFVFLFSESGIGKTTSLKAFYEKSKSLYYTNPQIMPIPFLFKLTSISVYTEKDNPNDSISNIILKFCERNLARDNFIDISNIFNDNDKPIILLLDGVDELNILGPLNDWILFQISKVRYNIKIIFTCRTEMLISRAFIKEFFENIKLIELKRWNLDYITKYIEKKYGSNQGQIKSALSYLDERYNLLDLASCPFLLAEILNYLDVLSKEITRNRANLYLKLVSIWLEKTKNRFERPVNLSLLMLRKFCHFLAAAEEQLKQNSVLLEDWIPENLKNWLNQEDQNFLRAYSKEQIHQILRKYTFLEIQNSDLKYGFRHRSIAEYLVAEWTVLLFLCYHNSKDELILKDFVENEIGQRNSKLKESEKESNSITEIAIFKNSYYTVNTWNFFIELVGNRYSELVTGKDLLAFCQDNCNSDLKYHITKWLFNHLTNSQEYLKSFAAILQSEENLNLSDFNLNNFNFPKIISYIHHIKSLNLQKNLLTYIPDEISDLSQLESIDISDNPINYINPIIQKCENLKEIKANLNLSNDPILKTINERGQNQGKKIAINYRFKIVVLGAPKVGKSSIIRGYVDRKIRGNYPSEEGVSLITKEVTFSNQNLTQFITLQIWEMGLQNLEKNKNDSYRGIAFLMRNAHGGIIIFNNNDFSTFQQAERYIKEVRKEIGDIPLILLNNKYDLTDNQQKTQQLHKKIQKFIRKYRLTAYQNIEAKNLQAIDNIFLTLIDSMISYQVNSKR